MGLFDRLRDGMGVQRPTSPERSEGSPDEQAIARYRYMLRTAPPEVIEEAHAEAFAKLTPEQRRRVLLGLSNAAPAGERASVLQAGDSPVALARVATRSEIREPGALERIFGGPRATAGSLGFGAGPLFAGSFLSSMAGTVLGSMIAQQFLHSHPDAAQSLGDMARHDADTALPGDPGVDVGDDSSLGFDGGGESWDV